MFLYGTDIESLHRSDNYLFSLMEYAKKTEKEREQERFSQILPTQIREIISEAKSNDDYFGCTFD